MARTADVVVRREVADRARHFERSGNGSLRPLAGVERFEQYFGALLREANAVCHGLPIGLSDLFFSRSDLFLLVVDQPPDPSLLLERFVDVFDRLLLALDLLCTKVGCVLSDVDLFAAAALNARTHPEIESHRLPLRREVALRVAASSPASPRRCDRSARRASGSLGSLLSDPAERSVSSRLKRVVE